MTKSVFVVVVGVGTTVVSLLGFVLSSGSPAAQVMYAFVGLYVVATVVLFLLTARTTSLSALVGFGLLTALISVGIEQLLGFYYFPGLVKDLEAFSWEHLQRLGVILVGALAWYSVVAVSTHVVVGRMRLL